MNYKGINELKIKKAINELFEGVTYDIDKLEELNEKGLLGNLINQYI